MMKLIRHNLPFLLFSLALCFLLMTGCANYGRQGKLSVPDVRPGFPAGYLPLDAAPNSLFLLPPPPPPGSAAIGLDEDISRKSLALYGSPRWVLAGSDADLSFPHAAGTFSCTLGIPISEEETPFLYILLRRTMTDAIISTISAKNYYRRVRPFAVNQASVCNRERKTDLNKDGSYPSGHTAIGWTWALILSELDPEHSDAILARGRAFGESRLVCNVHWHSDMIEGRLMGSAVVSRLHANSAFLADLKAAKDEIASVRVKKLQPARNCTEEAAALSRHFITIP
jgi:acid phosphatase (class A)